MAYALLARSATVSVTPYGVLTGTPSAGSATALCTLARNIRSEYTRDEIDQTGLCDTDKIFQAGTGGETFAMEVMVPSSGLIFQPLINQWVRIVIDPDGAGSLTTITVDGFVTSYSFEAETGGTQIERVTIRRRGTAFT